MSFNPNDMSRLFTSPQGDTWAGLVKLSSKEKGCVLNGELVASAKRLRMPQFLANGTIVNHVIEGDFEFVKVGDQEGGRYSSVTQLAVDGVYGYLGTVKPGKIDVVVNGEVVGTYKDAGDICVNGSNIAWFASMAGQKGLPAEFKGKEVLFHNGAQFAVHENIGYPAISSNGEVAYLSIGRKFSVIRGADELGAYERASPVRWSTSGEALAWSIVSGSKSSAVVNGETHGTHDEVGVVAVHDGSKFAYAARDGDEWRLAGSVDVGELERVSTIDYSTTGKLAAVVRKSDGLWVAVDNELFGPYENAGTTAFGADGEVKYWAETGDGKRLYSDGHAVTDAFEMISNIVVAGGESVAHVLEDGAVQRVTVPSRG